MRFTPWAMPITYRWERLIDRVQHIVQCARCNKICLILHPWPGLTEFTSNRASNCLSGNGSWSDDVTHPWLKWDEVSVNPNIRWWISWFCLFFFFFFFWWLGYEDTNVCVNGEQETFKDIRRVLCYILLIAIMISITTVIQYIYKYRRTLSFQIRTGLLISRFGPWRHVERDTILKSLC